MSASLGRALIVGIGAVLALPFAGCGESDGMTGDPSACGFPDGEPNNAAGNAASVGLDSAFMGCLTASDVDYLKIAAPAEPTGGYVEARITDVSGGTVRVRFLDTDGKTEIGSVTAPSPNAPLTVYFAVAGGDDGRIAISDAGGATGPYTYTLTATYHAVPDTYEPNDAKDAATAMTAGAGIQAYLFSGQRSAATASDTFNDYYRFTATADKVTVKMEDVPGDIAARLFMYAPDGSEVARVSSGLKGGALTMQPPVALSGGDYLVLVTLWTDTSPAFGSGDAPPAHFVQPYRLTLSQP